MSASGSAYDCASVSAEIIGLNRKGVDKLQVSRNILRTLVQIDVPGKLTASLGAFLILGEEENCSLALTREDSEWYQKMDHELSSEIGKQLVDVGDVWVIICWNAAADSDCAIKASEWQIRPRITSGPSPKADK